jgi:uncharacterized protein (PEP-CTERM system associated)
LGSRGATFDLFFTQFASIQPDPILRAQLVSEFLQANGISPDAQISGGTVASAPILERRQELTFAIQGIRDTFTLAAGQSESQNQNALVLVTDDFANGNIVKDRSFSAGWSHRLSPLSALNLIASIHRTTGSVGSQSTKLRSMELFWSGQPGPSTFLVIGGRHSNFDSPSSPYSESAVTATLSFRF